MQTVQYVTLDPTGNITCLVTSRPEGADEAAITRRLMQECEQVAYLDPPSLPGARASIRLMGGEFCGNAAMASACFLAEKAGVLSQVDSFFPLQVSGAEGVLSCRVRRTENGYEGTVPMPRVRSILCFEDQGRTLHAISMDGIAHLILPPPFPSPAEAEALLRRLAAERPEDAVGLLLWDDAHAYMRPLVLVKGSGTLVWETGCGSGSACIGAYRSCLGSPGLTRTLVHQPGGAIVVEAERHGPVPDRITITGRVLFGQEKTFLLNVSDEPDDCLVARTSSLVRRSSRF